MGSRREDIDICNKYSLAHIGLVRIDGSVPGQIGFMGFFIPIRIERFMPGHFEFLSVRFGQNPISTSA